MHKRNLMPAALLVGSFYFCLACGQQTAEDETIEGNPFADASVPASEAVVYKANLSSLNSEENGGRRVSGTTTFEVRDSLLVISVYAEGLEPNIMHQQHLHSFDNPRHARCPAGTEADTNEDGVVDILETRAAASHTMVPLHDNPASMEIHTDTYPVADSAGRISYRKEVNLHALSSAFKREFGQDTLDLSKQVLFIHGVSPNTPLPISVMSPPDLPAHVSVPVACGALER